MEKGHWEGGKCNDSWGIRSVVYALKEQSMSGPRGFEFWLGDDNINLLPSSLATLLLQYGDQNCAASG